jgi:hypothetical protein
MTFAPISIHVYLLRPRTGCSNTGKRRVANAGIKRRTTPVVSNAWHFQVSKASGVPARGLMILRRASSYPLDKAKNCHTIDLTEVPCLMAKDSTPGVKTKLNDDRQEVLINAVRIGTPLKTAAMFADIDEETIRQWRRRGEEARKIPPAQWNEAQRGYVEFMVQLNKALSEAFILAQRTIHQFMAKDLAKASDGDKQRAESAAKFMLTHRDPKNYTTRVEVTGADGSPVGMGMDVWEKMKKIAEASETSDDE